MRQFYFQIEQECNSSVEGVGVDEDSEDENGETFHKCDQEIGQYSATVEVRTKISNAQSIDYIY